MEDAIVLYPSPAIGHLVSMVELGKLILNNYASLSINILITPQAYNAGNTAPYIHRTSATTPSITFHNFPPLSLAGDSSSSTHHETLAFNLLRLNKPNIRKTLLSISRKYNVKALIMDAFCYSAADIAADLKIPAYYFFTSGAAFLASFLYFPTIHRNTTKSFKDLGAFELEIPGLPPVPASDMLKPILDRTAKAYDFFLEASINLSKSAGIIVNTFEELETRALKAITDGMCVADGPTPPVFCVGPLTAADQGNADGGGGVECLAWLDSQPSRSVVFLCFGSMGFFSEEQLKEMAVGLERSEQRFLWVVRSPPPDDRGWLFSEQTDPDLGSVLPEGFLGRTKERGLVVKSWAPQAAVLSHDAVGGFVTHCGWNSVLEAVCAGVPMVAWPLYAEQRFNRLILVEEMKVALPMKESEDGFVSAAEVEKRVRGVMDSEEGESVRERVLAVKDGAKAAIGKGGSSLVALENLVEPWKRI